MQPTAHTSPRGLRLSDRSLMTTPRTIRLAPEDNVVVAVDQIPAGAVAAGVTRARARAARPQDGGRRPIATASRCANTTRSSALRPKPISPGEWVHNQNVALHDFARDYRFAEGARNDEMLPPELRATFEGYLRPDGKTGTRNYIGILTSVNCSAVGREIHRRRGQALRHPRRPSRNRRRGAVRSRHRLRHGGLWRRLGRAAADAMGLCDASQSRRRR